MGVWGLNFGIWDLGLSGRGVFVSEPPLPPLVKGGEQEVGFKVE